MSRVVRGRVMHRRHRPVENRFVYPVFYVLLDIDELDGLNSWLFGVNRRRPVSFSFADHGEGGDPRTWLEALLRAHGLAGCDDRIWVQTFPRVLGFLFNPVSFWYCMDADGRLGAVVAEVNNTFGERHCYVLPANPEGDGVDGTSAVKAFYVSPFYPVRGEYRFHINTDFRAPRVRIDYFDDGLLQLNTAIWGRSEPFSAKALLKALARQPLLTLGVVARIHVQALRLWLKGVRLVDRSTHPVEEIPR